MNGALIVGGGQAAVQAALSLRDGDYAGEIMIVGSEPFGPYQRPPLSKEFLAGKATPDSLQFRKPEYYERNDIGIACGARVVDLELAAHGAPGDHGRITQSDVWPTCCWRSGAGRASSRCLGPTSRASAICAASPTQWSSPLSSTTARTWSL